MSGPRLSPSEFSRFFQTVHGQEPFPWQRRLAEKVFEDGWPQALDVPTGAGKTSSIDVAVFHLALEADRGKARRAPVRIGFVVDRRLVVDDAYARARTLSRALAEAQDGVVRRVADRLRLLSEVVSAPLAVARLRGGAPKEPDWARTPAQPTVLVSTVDQVGSRLLFRGYGVSDRMKPVHAGLLGCDSLLLLDEAHLSQPFAETLDGIKRFLGSIRATQVCFLSATQTKKAPRLVTDEDRKHEVLGPRLKSPKPTVLIRSLGGTKDDSFEESFVASAREKANASPRTVAVVVNRVARARSIFERLAREADGGVLDADISLLIGRSRPIERDRIVADLLPHVAAGRKSAAERSLVVVATQCIEAGADLDFDDLITEVAPLDSLRQRFGRLNRMGRDVMPSAVIIAASDQLGARAQKDPLYGAALAATWEFLLSTAGKPRRGHDAELDFGIEPSRRWLPEGEALEALIAPRRQAPVLMPGFVEQWMCTSPIPEPDPDVSLFLHGPEAGPPDVQVVWRGDLDGATTADWAERVEALPPSSLEAVSVPLFAVRHWLSGKNATAQEMADLEGAPDPEEPRRQRAQPGRDVVLWLGPGDSRVVTSAAVRPGQTIVVPVAYGGCDVWGWAPASQKQVVDLADQAALAHRGWRVLRPSVALLRQACSQQAESDGMHTQIQDEAAARGAKLQKLLDELAEEPDRTVAERLIEWEHWPVSWCARLPDAARARVVRGRSGQPLAVISTGHAANQDSGGAAVTEDDRSSLGTWRSVVLSEHSKGVESWARRFAEQTGLAEEVAADVGLAAFLHDAGKAHPQFKAWLYGGDEVMASSGPALAKSLKLSRESAARERSGLVRGARHEVASLGFARAHPRFSTAYDPDLVLWLIGTHHGYGRPFFPPVEWPRQGESFGTDLHDGFVASEPHMGLAGLTAEWLERHERLTKRYGAWGLAHLETVLRLADHRRSEAEQEEP